MAIGQCQQSRKWPGDIGLEPGPALSNIPGVFKLRAGALLTLAALGVTGCRTASQPPAPVAVVTVPEEIVIAPPAPLLPVPAPAPATNAFPPRPAWPVNWSNVWLALPIWTRFNGLGDPVQTSAGLNPSFAVRTANGPLTLAVNSRVARGQGVECWLGYPPQFLKGQPHVHALDARKVLQPLLATPPRLPTGRTVVIDPGHGGKDNGTQSVFSKEFEKLYTLDWALRLRRLLATNGWRVVLTRTNDSDVSLAERVAVAERARADLFLSLHFNSGLPNHGLAGLETFCLTPAGLPSSLVRDYADDPRVTYPNNAFDEENFLWACRLHRALLEATGAADRGVRRARFMGVLRGQNRPAVLLEAGYLSNLAEATRLASAEYRQTLAEAVARALMGESGTTAAESRHTRAGPD
jgi:N-acetylmuramoyl-L-alanine amidase